MVRITADELAGRMRPVPDEYWDYLLDTGSGSLQHDERVADEGDVLIVGETEFEVVSVTDERDTGVLVYRFEERE